MYKKLLSIIGCFTLVSITTAVFAEGNRYDLPRLYQSEISAAKAYLLTSHNKGQKSRGHNFRDAFSNAVIIDVRTIDEHTDGHPNKSYNIPYPHIYNRKDSPDMHPYIPQDPVQFVNDVLAAFPNKSTPILTLCRTGYRSVLAANLLTEAGYTNVRNIWQGFVGNPKVDTSGNVLDLNNNGVDGDLGDLDGWSGYQELPVSTKLHPRRIYQAYAWLYYE